jgi:uncharacterized protein (TIRG00374 family)
MERVLGAAGTLLLVAIGLVFAIGRYDDIALVVWLEGIFVVATALIFLVMFSRRANTWLQARSGSRRLARALQSVWQALHDYRLKPRVLIVVTAATVGIQALRIVAIWLCGEAVGVNVSVLVYIVMGPLLFLIMLIPFTINGLGVREAFFIAFLGRFGVSADAAFATGFLFYAIAIGASLPGALIILWESVRPPRPAQPVDPSSARVP